MSLSKILTCKGTLRQVFICLGPRTPLPPPLLHTVYVYTVLLILTGKGGGVELERGLEEQQFTKLGRKYQHECLYLQSIYSEIHWSASL